jgi:hypothetical protein
MMYFGDRYVRRIYLGGALLKEFPVQGDAPFGMQGLLMTTTLGSPTLSEVVGVPLISLADLNMTPLISTASLTLSEVAEAVLISPAGLSMAPLMYSMELTPSSVAGIAYVETQGQSNITGFNSVDALPSAQLKTYANVSAFELTSGLGTTASVVERLPYTLVPDGQTIDGVVGRKGERNIGSSSGGVGPTYGVVKGYDDNGLYATAEALWLMKASTPGTHIDEFLPINAAAVWKNLVYGRRAVRTAVLASETPVLYQSKIWMQGEANTNAPRAAENLSHPDIVEYPAKFEQVYAFDVAQMGEQPTWFICQLSVDGGGVANPYTAAINAQLKSLCGFTVDATGTITANGSGNPNRYFVEHNITNGVDVHLNAIHMGQLGAIIDTAEKTIHAGDGLSSALPVLPRPVILNIETGTVTGGSVALTLTTTDVGTIYTASVPAGSDTPTDDEIINGGGDVTARGSQVFSGLFAPGSTLATTLTGIPTGGSVDIHAILRNGLNSLSRSVTGIAIAAAPVASGWDTTFQTGFITYSNNGGQANNTAGAIRYARSAQGQTTGKRMFQINTIGTLSFAGIADVNLPVGGGSSSINGTERVGWLFGNVVSSGSNVPMGEGVNTADTVQIAVDLDARLLWIKKESVSVWNNNASANPATGVGGVSIANMPVSVLPVAGLASGPENGAILNLSPATRPAGFGTWA